MIMILQFKDDMDKWNKFFRMILSNPTIIWAAIASVIFVVMGMSILINPAMIGTDRNLGFGFGGILTIYGIYRFWTFYQRYKENSRKDD